MQQFGTAEVSRLTAIPIPSIRGMVRAGYVSPVKGGRGALRFSFQDLVLLRAARQLREARISPRRIGEALRSLRAQLPEDPPLRGLSVTAAGGRVVVQEAGEQRDALSGQLLLAFEVRLAAGQVELIDTASTREPRADVQPGECERQFEAALELEDTNVDAAVEAYRACVASHAHTGARANLGRLLHLQGRISEAVSLYRAEKRPDADLLYNLAVALEDLGKTQEAMAAYGEAIQLDAGHLEAHHNLARLWQQAGDERRALRHWNAYRRLARGMQ